MTMPWGGGRKFIVVMLALVFAFILAMLKSLTGDFATVVSVCVGAFMASHMVQDYRAGNQPSTTTSTTTTTKGPEPPAPSDA